MEKNPDRPFDFLGDRIVEKAKDGEILVTRYAPAPEGKQAAKALVPNENVTPTARRPVLALIALLIFAGGLLIGRLTA